MGERLIRVTIRVDEEDYALAKREAIRLRISMAELLRRTLRKSLQHPEYAPWMRYAGLVASGDPRSSLKIDKVIYEPES
jgi:hypothetical protein